MDMKAADMKLDINPIPIAAPGLNIKSEEDK